MNFQMYGDPIKFESKNNIITMEAGGGTNLFNDMCSDYRGDYFQLYHILQTGDFVARCKIKPEFKAIFDLGSIIVYDNPDKWIKFAFENADSGHPAMVSVITDGVSDDCNGEKIYEDSVWMQIIRKDNNFALHYSFDKNTWILVRIFQLPMKNEIMLGISAQSPIGNGCTVQFEDFEILENTYTNMRKPE